LGGQRAEGLDASAYFRLYHPAAFWAGLLRGLLQSPVADARRHGVIIHSPDINASLAHAGLDADDDSTGGVAVRLGLGTIRNLGADAAQALVDERDTHGPTGTRSTSVDALVD
jgi:error-prone DNA polymerase